METWVGMTRALLIVGTLATMTMPARASDKRQGSTTTGAAGSKLIDDIAACAALGEPAARLACYDSAAAALVAARDQKKIYVTDKEDARKTRRSLFGFVMPKLHIFGPSDDGDDIKEVNASITSIVPRSGGHLLLRLDDGSSWETDEALVGFDPKNGQNVRIKRGAIGSYIGTIAGRVSARMHRLN